MVRAILGSLKTQTRRVITPQPSSDFISHQICSDGKGGEELYFNDSTGDDDLMGWFPSYDKGIKLPHNIGDILYVRETWQHAKTNHNTTPSCNICLGCDAHKPQYLYRADYSNDESFLDYTKWKPSIHMPKEAVRIFLRVTDVRVERLQDISGADCAAEGIAALYTPSQRHRETANHSHRDYVSGRCTECAHLDMETGLRKASGFCRSQSDRPITYYDSIGCSGGAFSLRPDDVYEPLRWRFMYLWDSIQRQTAKPKGRWWSDNPWVWVYEFERVDRDDVLL